MLAAIVAVSVAGMAGVSHAEMASVSASVMQQSASNTETLRFVPSPMVEEALAAPAAEPAPATDGNVQDLGIGIASYYASRFEGRRTASGEPYRAQALTAAHRSLPFGSKVRVTNPSNGRSVVVTINDRGPFTPGRTIDLSRVAAEEIGLVRAGHGPVQLELFAS